MADKKYEEITDLKELYNEQNITYKDVQIRKAYVLDKQRSNHSLVFLLGERRYFPRVRFSVTVQDRSFITAHLTKVGDKVAIRGYYRGLESEKESLPHIFVADVDENEFCNYRFKQPSW